MAPTTRASRSQQAPPAEDLDQFDHEYSDEDHDRETVQDLLQPLHDTADRVSKGVEDFARCLHKFRAQHTVLDAETWNDARRLLEDFNIIATDTLSETRSRQSRIPASRHDEEFQEQLRKLALEGDLWLLASNLLLSRAPNALEIAAINQADRLKDLHRYSNNADLWNAFLDSDTVAQEYETILVWLHERAGRKDSQIRLKVADLVSQSNRGDMSSAVPIYTSHHIKHKKRLIVRSGPMDADSDGRTSQLDPDASTRQKTSLDPQDESYENASWQICWEMLRGGRVFKDAQSWWSDAKEPYRSVLCSISDAESSPAFDSPFLRIMNLASNNQWLRLCKIAARDSAIIGPVQRAVFGLLCGESAASNLACEEVDDMVFSQVNSLLIERYLHFVSAYREKLVKPDNFVYRPLMDKRKPLEDLFGTMQSSPDFKEEMQVPHKFIEAALMSMDPTTFFCEIGQGVAHMTYSTGRFDHLIEQTEPVDVSECVRTTASDADSVRIVAHLQLVLQSIGALDVELAPQTATGTKLLKSIENNIASYIGYLQQEKKWSLIPVYASQLSQKRCSSVLGATMIDITDIKERDRLVRLMRKCNVNVAETLFAIAVAATDPKLGHLRPGSVQIEADLITERSPIGQTKIRPGFMSDDLSIEEDRAILGVEWYRWVDAENWGKACFSIATLYKLWLVKGRFSALGSLAQRANLAEVSLAALSMNLNFGSDEDDEDSNDDHRMDDSDEPSGVMSPRKRQDKRVYHPLAEEGTSREILYHKSSVWMQLEQLVNALQALEEWQELADTIDANRNNKAAIASMKRELKDALGQVQVAIAPVLEQDFLCNPFDEQEAKILSEIRIHYLPELVLGYNSVLFFAGYAISRTWLGECMELANIVATTPSLTEAFVIAGRMRELVTALALDSQSLFAANEAGAKKPGEKKVKALDMWTVHWKEMNAPLRN